MSMTEPIRNPNDLWRRTMLTKLMVGAFLSVALIAGGGAAWQSASSCCAPGADCCNPPQECCATGDCCTANAACCETGAACCAK